MEMYFYLNWQHRLVDGVHTVSLCELILAWEYFSGLELTVADGL